MQDERMAYFDRRIKEAEESIKKKMEGTLYYKYFVERRGSLENKKMLSPESMKMLNAALSFLSEKKSQTELEPHRCVGYFPDLGLGSLTSESPEIETVNGQEIVPSVSEEKQEGENSPQATWKVVGEPPKDCELHRGYWNRAADPKEEQADSDDSGAL